MPCSNHDLSFFFLFSTFTLIMSKAATVWNIRNFGPFKSRYLMYCLTLKRMNYRGLKILYEVCASKHAFAQLQIDSHSPIVLYARKYARQQSARGFSRLAFDMCV
uniref:(northern house mosquito) hypothetical protein n=1 Tax=Culex pipiens TaxID=7175 RepID=A0A8D8K8U7_CULPI